MINDLARNVAGIGSLGLTLLRLWRVEVTEQECRYPAGHWPGHVLIRTLTGEGRLAYLDGRERALVPGSVVIADGMKIVRHGCAKGPWRYWFFHFLPASQESVPYALDELLDLPPLAGEEEQMRLIQEDLRNGSPARAMLASTRFAQLLCLWNSAWQGGMPQEPGRRAMERITRRMQDKLAHSWRVAEMAAEAKLPPREFRRQFERVFACSPKVYYDNLRLEHARELLRQRWKNLKQVAAELGYSSPFHLSRAYKKHFGVPPAHDRVRTPQKFG